MSVPTPEVVQVLNFSKNWDRLAIEKVRNFFDQRNQLIEIWQANGEWNLKVRFHDDVQAEAFRQALGAGELGKPRQNGH